MPKETEITEEEKVIMNENNIKLTNHNYLIKNF